MHYIVQQAHFYETKCKVNISSIYRITMSNSINLNCQDSAKHPLLSHWGNTTEIWESTGENCEKEQFKTYWVGPLDLQTMDSTSSMAIVDLNAVLAIQPTSLITAELSTQTRTTNESSWESAMQRLPARGFKPANRT